MSTWLPYAGCGPATTTTPEPAAKIGVPAGALKSMPSCSAERPVIGSMRQPKREPSMPSSSGWPLGSRRAITWRSTSSDSSSDRASPRRSAAFETWSIAAESSSSDSGRDSAGSGPPRPGGVRTSSAGLMPAMPATRSPTASSRVSCACSSPSRTASASMFWRTKGSRSPGCAANDAIQFCTTGSRASRPSRRVTYDSSPDAAATTSMPASAVAASHDGRSVSVRACRSRGWTMIICTRFSRAARRALLLPACDPARPISPAP